MKKILIIEDDRALGEGIALGLGTNTYEFTRCETLKEAEEAWEKEAFDLVILDLNLPDGSGYPFHLAVLRARIQNLLRMTAKEDKNVYENARFRFDFAKLYYQKDGQTVVLSNTEQKLLKLLVDNQKTTLSRQMLIDRVGCSHAFSEAEWKKVKQMYSIAGGALSFILALIGVLNFVNVITTSILSRKQEFAMMESIGMTVGQQKWILRLEGLFYAVLTIFISVSLGSAISYAVVRAVTAQMWMFEYHFTLVPILYSIPILLLITWLVPEFCYQRMQKITVVERLREVEN